MTEGDKLAELFAKAVPRASPATPWVRSIVTAQGLGALLGIGGLLSGSVDIFSSVLLAALLFVVREAVRAFRGNSVSLKRMEWVLAAQVPWLNVHSPAFHYDNFLFLDCTIRLGDSTHPLELGFGTRLEAYAGTSADPAYFGFNLVAIVFLEVLRRARSARTISARTGTPGGQ
jgi:hypothetical protein